MDRPCHHRCRDGGRLVKGSFAEVWAADQREADRLIEMAGELEAESRRLARRARDLRRVAATLREAAGSSQVRLIVIDGALIPWRPDVGS